MASKRKSIIPQKDSNIYRICKFLKDKGSPATKSQIMRACNLRVCNSIYDASREYPHLVKKIHTALFEYVASKHHDDLFEHAATMPTRAPVKKRTPKPIKDTPHQDSLASKVCKYLKDKREPVKLDQIIEDCGLSNPSTPYSLNSKYPHLVRKVAELTFQYVGPVEGDQQEEVIKIDPQPKLMTLEAKVCKYLKKVGHPVHVQTIKKDCGINNDNTIFSLYKKYPHLVTKVRRGIYQYVGPMEADQQQQLIIENPLFAVPVSRVLNNAKFNRPVLQRLSDEELIRYHLLSNKNVFKKGVDYVGDDLAKLKLTYRASLRLATMLGSPETRSDIEEAKATADGEGHIRSFDLDLLMPDGAPQGCPVSFDALIEALDLSRASATKKLIKDFSSDHVKSSHTVTRGRPKVHHWLTEDCAKRFVFNLAINPKRKEPIYDYFIRREQEAQDYRERDRQELTAPSEFTSALTGLTQAVTLMLSQQQQTTALLTQLVNRQNQYEDRLDHQRQVIDKQAEAIETGLSNAKQQVAKWQEIADEANHGRTRRIETYTINYPLTSSSAALRSMIYTKDGKPHSQAMKSVADVLQLFDHGLAMLDDESGDHRFVRFNNDALSLIKTWRQDCLDQGIETCEIPRSKTSSWHVYFTKNGEDLH